jgi:hypothetical protein
VIIAETTASGSEIPWLSCEATKLRTSIPPTGAHWQRVPCRHVHHKPQSINYKLPEEKFHHKRSSGSPAELTGGVPQAHVLQHQVVLSEISAATKTLQEQPRRSAHCSLYLIDWVAGIMSATSTYTGWSTEPAGHGVVYNRYAAYRKVYASVYMWPPCTWSCMHRNVAIQLVMRVLRSMWDITGGSLR